jgi:hypothetical protein
MRELGDKFIVYDTDNQLIGQAEPGFTPLPKCADWVARVEYTQEHGLPHPYGWPRGQYAAWSARELGRFKGG